MRRGAIWAWFKARGRDNGGPIVRPSNAEPGPKRSRPFGLLPKRTSAALLALPEFPIPAASRALRTRFLAVQRMRESKSDRLLASSDQPNAGKAEADGHEADEAQLAVGEL